MKPATAATQSELGPKDLEPVLAPVRGRTLTDAGRRPGTIRSARWAGRRCLERLPAGHDFAAMTWASPDADEDLVDYPSKRRRHARYPQVVPQVSCDGMLAVAQAIEAELAIGVAPYFPMAGRPGLVDLSGHLPEVDVDAWLPTHPDIRHLRRVEVFFEFVRQALVPA